ncbi:MAG: response regulator [Prochloraceae cyanobacterium]|nr:response regulator [Prochloraceae cyanobacterium]
MKILLIEDDEIVVQGLIKALSAQNYIIDVAADGQEGWELVEAYTYDLILLDVILPKLDGISFCRQLRSQNLKTPVILLTGVDSSTNKVMGLDAGADDYVTKPFDLQELLARIRALLRRGSSPLPPVLKWGDLHLDPGAMEVHYNSQQLHLTPKEYALLELFMRNPQRVFSRGAIIDRLWSFEESPGEETVTAHIKGLRMKLRKKGLSDDPIETVYGIGYRLKPTNQQQQGHNKQRSKKQKKLTPEAQQKAVAVATSIWQHVQAKFSTRVAVLEKVTTAIAQNRLNEELRKLAISEAHKLAGSLGTFNFDEGSRTAKKVEQLLLSSKPLTQKQKRHLSDLVGAIRAELEKATHSDLPDILSVDERPLLSIVGNDRSLTEQLVRESENWGIQTTVAIDYHTAIEEIERERPDVFLLVLSETASSDNNLKLLEELSASGFSVPVLVLTSANSLLDRVKIARLGGRKFLRAPLSPAQILEAITGVLQSIRAPEAKVTIVDDDPEILTSVQKLLEPWGLEVNTLENPLKFWETLEATSPDLLILDVEMPSVSGIELCQVVRNDLRWAGLPVLFLTAHVDAQTRHKVFAVGGDDYVSKPIVGSELVTRILNRLERSRLLKLLAETDTLTGVANRHKFIQELNRLLTLAKTHQQPCCFAILKLEELKQINDQYGHAIADRFLSRFGELLRQNFNAEDAIGRSAGAEFLVGMYGTTKRDGAIRLSQLLEDLKAEEFTTAEGTKLTVTFRAAIVEYPDRGSDWRSLYRSADSLLQKDNGTSDDRFLSEILP